MTAFTRSALAVMLTVVCVALALLAAVHGIVWLALILIVTAALFAWAVYDNRRLARQRAIAGAPDGRETVRSADRDPGDGDGGRVLR
jgi:Ca2+/Na+ antiporter